MSRAPRMTTDELAAYERKRAGDHAPPPKRWRIGIDGGRNTGWAIVDTTTGAVENLGTADFWTVFDFLSTAYRPEHCVIVIEDPRGNRPTFDHGEAAARKREKISQNVGSVKRESALLAEGFRRKGFEVHTVTPRRHKITADEFARAVCERRCSQHARDAAMLVWGAAGYIPPA